MKTEISTLAQSPIRRILALGDLYGLGRIRSLGWLICLTLARRGIPWQTRAEVSDKCW
jgi:hypothetical protein